MLTLVCHFKLVMPPRWQDFKTRVGFTMTLFNLLIQWDGLSPDVDGFVRLSMGSIQSLNSHQWLVAFCKRINEQIESPAQQIPNTTNHHIAQK